MASGLDRGFISLLELGQRSPSLDTMIALSRGLQIPFSRIALLLEEQLIEAGHIRHKPNNGNKNGRA